MSNDNSNYNTLSFQSQQQIFQFLKQNKKIMCLSETIQIIPHPNNKVNNKNKKTKQKRLNMKTNPQQEKKRTKRKE